MNICKIIDTFFVNFVKNAKKSETRWFFRSFGVFGGDKI